MTPTMPRSKRKWCNTTLRTKEPIQRAVKIYVNQCSPNVIDPRPIPKQRNPKKHLLNH